MPEMHIKRTLALLRNAQIFNVEIHVLEKTQSRIRFYPHSRNPHFPGMSTNSGYAVDTLETVEILTELVIITTKYLVVCIFAWPGSI